MFRLDADYRRLYMRKYDPCPVMFWVRPLVGKKPEDQMLVFYGADGEALSPEIIHVWIIEALRGKL